MKRYKIQPLNSYYYYKKRKNWLKEILLFIIGMGVICLGIVGNGNLGDDLKALRLKKEISAESVYIDGNKVAYGLYKQKQEVKGIYIPASKIDNYEEYIAMAKRTDVNSFVIDVKNDQGYLTFTSDNEKLVNMGCVLADPPIENIGGVMKRLYEEDIYPIARIVTFKDNVATKHFPNLAVKKLDGRVYELKSGDRWLDPYNQENWDYILEVCKEAIKIGFKEIQFDYIRFHESMDEEIVQLPPNKTKSEVITEFVTFISKQLEEYGVSVSADVFGTIIMSKIDGENVGQDFKELCKHLDYICPMIYPSHYADGTFGIQYPHIQCYDIILKSMELAQDKILENPRIERKAKIRPWLQDFTLAGMKPYQFYGEEQIRSQIQGTYDAGVNEWLFWNASGKYTEAGLDEE
ncbi:putative glycoside hydrolase [Cellulosilyticum ruminicola]|uniref:putative glycoside hydrolase n=1 Tax=Cellulosilyticum ruminicola TaxID=425254 RepID=UPI0006D0E90B|nr:putative glycoside hydrolase [Cellulosilyticum ruminicola]